ncbi:hypothetical protein [Paracidovorax citrulli]|uniref:hypothetical protein n=1 Tax=Paracidovorax citrulli TaxID=80869 RepID=UPI003FA6BC20
MKKLEYRGFSNTPSECKYGIGVINGKTAIVFHQTVQGGTSITNMIEHLTMHVLATDLPRVDPNQVRVFEHYDQHLRPVSEWQEVTFQEMGEIQEEKNIAEKLIEFVSRSSPSKRYYVDGPSWGSVNPNDLATVKNIQ